jgi:hypothetical protein
MVLCAVVMKEKNTYQHPGSCYFSLYYLQVAHIPLQRGHEEWREYLQLESELKMRLGALGK